MMRALVRAFDRFLCRATGVFEFCDDPECLGRLQWARAPHDLSLSDGTQVRAGAPVLMLHNVDVQPGQPAGAFPSPPPAGGNLDVQR